MSPNTPTPNPDAALPYDIPDCHCQHVTGGRCMFAATASPGLDVERARQIFHNEYEVSETGCRHQNQHKASWDCQSRVNEFAAEYVALAADREGGS